MGPQDEGGERQHLRGLLKPPRKAPPAPKRSEGDDPMAKGQQRGNREKKKPKQEKPKPAASSPFAAQGAGAGGTQGAGGKRK